jgi:Zn-dependent alcohol dehydrogenase
MLNKDKVKELVDHMPETFSVDDIVEEIILLQKIEMARKQIRNGEFITEEELDKEIDQWD